MKKFLSLFLVLAMTLSMLTIPTFAEDPAPTLPTPQHVLDIADSVAAGATVQYNGEDYTVIRDAAGIQAMVADKNYILAQDIDFTGVTVNSSYVTATGGYVLEGNGFTWKNVAFVSSAA